MVRALEEAYEQQSMAIGWLIESNIRLEKSKNLFSTFIYCFQPEGVVTFDWTAQQQAYVLSGYFWGYAITCLVGGTAAEMWGPRKVVFITMLFSSLLTILSPPAARLHYLVLVAIRFVTGLAAVSIPKYLSCH